MKISEFTEHEQLDELSAADAGNKIGGGVRAVGSGVKNFAKGFGQGLMGKKNAPAAAAAPKVTPTKPGAPAAKPGTAPAAKVAQPAASPNMDAMKKSIASMQPKQRAAIRQQASKKAGVV
jgi:hypothetical protein|tara:strand:+ start:339 stop:698 length:360 start_codon:yes stop_codon:yes gene_type:complete